MSNLIRKTTPDRSKIDLQDAKQVKYWTKALGVSNENLLEVIDKVGNAAATVRNELKRRELAMPKDDKPLKPDDFPVNAEGKEIKKQDGTPIAKTDDPATASDVAERLNEDEARREEDKWSA
jgi:Protein of unknown function (DUF3606)